MSHLSRLDELEDLNAHGCLFFWEHPELWVRRSPYFYSGLLLAILILAVI